MTVPDVLDGEALRSLLSMVGDDPEFVGELVDTYLEDAHGQLAAMRAAVDAGSAGDLRRPAHTLKSNSANVGATSLASICRELEAQAVAGSLAGAADRLGAAEAEFERVAEALAAARTQGWSI